MKRLSIILSLLLLIGCSKSFYVKNTGDHKDEFVIDNERRCGKYVIYTDVDTYFFDIEKDIIYHRRDIFNIGDTLILKEKLNKKYIKVSKYGE